MNLAGLDLCTKMLGMNQSAYSILMLRKLYKLRVTYSFWICLIHLNFLSLLLLFVLFCLVYFHFRTHDTFILYIV